MRSRRHFLNFLKLTSFTAALTARIKPGWSRIVRVRDSGWLEIRQLQGKVIYHRIDQVRQAAWTGLRLQRVGEALESRKRAKAVLALDNGLGFLHVGENTQFHIQTLHTTAEGGRVTLLKLTQGQMRLKVRPMSNPASRLEIHTPAGISGVRGTEFGIAVQPSGKTSIATRSGLVAAIAQGVTVGVGQEKQNLTMAEAPPEPAIDLRDDPSIMMQQAKLEGDHVRLVGQTDPVNNLLVEDEPQDTDREGYFNLLISKDERDMVVIRVVTPLGTERKYELPLC